MRSSNTAKVSSKRRSICARRSSLDCGPAPDPPPALLEGAPGLLALPALVELPLLLEPALPPDVLAAPVDPVDPVDTVDCPAWPPCVPDAEPEPCACPVEACDESAGGVGQRCGAGSPGAESVDAPLDPPLDDAADPPDGDG